MNKQHMVDDEQLDKINDICLKISQILINDLSKTQDIFCALDGLVLFFIENAPTMGESVTDAAKLWLTVNRKHVKELCEKL